jgi:ketosteroid isomerase-like protein
MQTARLILSAGCDTHGTMPRHRDERLALRFPGLYRRLVRYVAAQPPGSLFRRRVLKRMVSRSQESFSRGDIEVALLISHPDVEIRAIRWEALGLSERYHGHDGWRAFVRDWLAEWGDYEQAPEQLTDLGDRLIMRTKAAALGKRSGVAVVLGVCYCVYFTDGQITRWDVAPSWPDLAKELGLDDAAQLATST